MAVVCSGVAGADQWTCSFSFAGDPDTPTAGAPVTWLQSTVTVPQSVDWQSSPAEQVSGWVMGDLGGAYSQVGWLWYEPNAGPQLFAANGADAGATNTYTFGDDLVLGQSITVAVSCDLGTDVWHDWVDGGDWHLLASAPLSGLACGEAGLRWQREVEGDLTDAQGPPPVLVPGASFTATVVDQMGTAVGWADLTNLTPQEATPSDTGAQPPTTAPPTVTSGAGPAAGPGCRCAGPPG